MLSWLTSLSSDDPSMGAMAAFGLLLHGTMEAPPLLAGFCARVRRVRATAGRDVSLRHGPLHSHVPSCSADSPTGVPEEVGPSPRRGGPAPHPWALRMCVMAGAVGGGEERRSRHVETRTRSAASTHPLPSLVLGLVLRALGRVREAPVSKGRGQCLLAGPCSFVGRGTVRRDNEGDRGDRGAARSCRLGPTPLPPLQTKL